MSKIEPCLLSATEAAAAIAAGMLTSEALVRSCLDRIGAREPILHAWAHLDPELALAQARAADKTSAGPFPAAAVPGEGNSPPHTTPSGPQSPPFSREAPFPAAARPAPPRPAPRA